MGYLQGSTPAIKTQKKSSKTNDDGVYWQKNKTWKGLIKWDEEGETPCEMATSRSINHSDDDKEAHQLSEEINVKFVFRII